MMGKKVQLGTGFLAFVLLAPAAAADDLGLRVPPGFKVTPYADHDLANDIYAMTLDSHGRVVVTSQGYIKTLHDTAGRGKADRATLFATTSTGGMGLCFDGDDLYFCGEGWFQRYRDAGGRGKADGPPERFFPLRFAEHGGHAMRKGPDGWWYLIGGNDSGIDRRHVTRPHSPVQNPEAGALLRLPPDCRQCEVIAHGFRNPYDFDFNAAGDLFTYDSDVERDFFLPWYTPTRMYHIGYAAHHGWRLTGFLRSWSRLDYYADTVDMLWPVGRGSPTGVVCYRHEQFPEHYRGGLFALDWTFGKVYFFPLQPDGASYRTRPEVFLESVGTNGFAPTDVVVAPDGTLFLSIGGRHTRGAVYRIEYVGDGKRTVPRRPAPSSDLEAVLFAHQPLDAWSRARWMPLARVLGPAPFAAAVGEEKREAVARVRAVEVLTELFGGLPKPAAEEGSHSSSPLVRARVAWSLGRMPCPGFAEVLQRLASDREPRVRCYALAALADHATELDADPLRKILPTSFASRDKRVRQAAARLATLLPQESWQRLLGLLAQAGPQARLTGALAEVWRTPPTAVQEPIIDQALAVLHETRDNDLRLQAVRLLMLAGGDFHLQNPPVEAYTAYSLQLPFTGHEAAVARVLRAVRPLFPSGDERLDTELARLLAMLEDDDPASLGKVAAHWTDASSATQDVHYLVVFSRLRGQRSPGHAEQVARVVLALHRKLEGREQRTKQTWSERLAEVLAILLARDPRLAPTLLRHPEFVNPGHVSLAAAFTGDDRRRAARLFLDAVRKDADFAWSEPLVDLLAELPAVEVRPVLRGQWSNFGLRDPILLQLARNPEAVDRDKFLVGLGSSQRPVTRACLEALQQLPRDESPEHVVPLVRLLRQLLQEPKENGQRDRVVALLARQTGQAWKVHENGSDLPALKRVYQPIFDWFERRHPTLVRKLHGDDGEDAAAWGKLLASADWGRGKPEHGEVLFRERGCQTCHTGSTRLGPDLVGVTNRFSRDELFTAIIYPSRDVAPAYRTNVIETKQGQLVSGIVVFESADGVILQTDATTTLRIATDEMVSRLPSDRSLMPSGLLKDLKPEDLADLYCYLRTLQPKPAGGRALP